MNSLSTRGERCWWTGLGQRRCSTGSPWVGLFAHPSRPGHREFIRGSDARGHDQHIWTEATHEARPKRSPQGVLPGPQRSREAIVRIDAVMKERAAASDRDFANGLERWKELLQQKREGSTER